MKKEKISVSWSHEKDLNSEFTFISLVDTEYHLKLLFCIMQDDETKDIVSLTVYGDDYRKSSYKDWTVYRDNFDGFINRDNLAEAIHWISYNTINNMNCVNWFDHESICELKYKAIRELSDIIYSNKK